MKDYLTLAKESRAELTERRSRFIATAAPTQTAGEAEAFIARVKAEFCDATHNVWAYLIDDGHMRASDDGEPSGTAGTPTLEALKKAGLKKAAVVVTRYFGGVLLGAGGLVRAYGAAANLGINAAGPVKMVYCERFTVAVEYSDSGRVRSALEQSPVLLLHTRYGSDVGFDCAAEADLAPLIYSKLTELTSARAAITRGEPGFFPFEGR